MTESAEDDLENLIENCDIKVPREFGDYFREHKAVQAAVTSAISSIASRRVNEIIPEENTRRFMHGGGWSTPASPELEHDELVTIEDRFELKWEAITSHDLSAMLAAIAGIGNRMADQQIRLMFQTVSRICDKSGNVVSAVEKSMPEAFMEMLEKIEFGVGADGEVSLPSIFVGPDMGNRIVEELMQQPPEFQAKAQALIEEKKASALADEKLRLERFKVMAQ